MRFGRVIASHVEQRGLNGRRRRMVASEFLMAPIPMTGDSKKMAAHEERSKEIGRRMGVVDVSGQAWGVHKGNGDNTSRDIVEVCRS